MQESVSGEHHIKSQMNKFPGGRKDMFMLLPTMEEATTWIDGGLVKVGVEARVIGPPGGEVMNRGPSVHIYDSGSGEEWLRFDCFDKYPHYHYILQADQNNIVWGFDPATNGDVYPWVIRMLRDRLPDMLLVAGADELSKRVSVAPLSEDALQAIRQAMDDAYKKTFPGTEMIEPTIAWAMRWKELNPDFGEV